MIRLTNIARVKRILNITTTEDDTLITQLVGEVSRQIERHLGRHVEIIARTQQYDIFHGQRTVFLRGYPILATPAPLFREDVNRTFTGSDIAADNYYVRSDEGSVTFDRYVLTSGDGVFRAVYTGGMAYTLDRIQMTVTGQAGVAPAVGATVTGGTSGATGTLVSLAAGVLILTADQNGDFSLAETLTSGVWSATLSTIDREPLVTTFADVVKATEWQISFDFERRHGIGVQSISAEGGSYSIDPATKLLKGVLEMLEPYRSTESRI